MKKPKRMNKKKSKKLFRKTSGTNSRNAPTTIMRGGYRL